MNCVKIDIPKYPLYLRPKTSDLANYVQIFIQRNYACTEVLEDVSLIVDLGAYIGYSVIWFAQKFPQAEIVAVEPDEGNFKMLVNNTQNYENIIGLVKNPVWPFADITMKRSCQKFRDGLDWSRQFEPNGNGSLKSITVSEIIKQFSTQGKIDLLKIDIEGAESILFSNDYSEWLPKVQNIVIELHDDSIFGNATRAFKQACDDQFTLQQFGEITFAQRII